MKRFENLDLKIHTGNEHGLSSFARTDRFCFASLTFPSLFIANGTRSRNVSAPFAKARVQPFRGDAYKSLGIDYEISGCPEIYNGSK